MEFSFIYFFDHLGIDINTHDLDATFGGDDSSRQSDVAKTYETCFHKNY